MSNKPNGLPDFGPDVQVITAGSLEEALRKVAEMTARPVADGKTPCPGCGKVHPKLPDFNTPEAAEALVASTEEPWEKEDRLKADELSTRELQTIQEAVGAIGEQLAESAIGSMLAGKMKDSREALALSQRYMGIFLKLRSLIGRDSTMARIPF